MEVPGYGEVQVRCRKCQGCLRQRQFEWKNRMLLECFGKKIRPLFLTWTFSPRFYVDDKLHVLKEVQKLFKRLRKAGHDIRYFNVIERGKKKGRLYAHSVIWSESLSQLAWADKFYTFHDKWGNGAIKLRIVRSPGAFHYVSKYLVKDMLEDVQFLTGEIKTGRNYQFLINLGQPGIDRWKYLCDKMEFHVEQLSLNWFNMPFLGKLEKVYISSDTWKRYCKNRARNANVPDIDIIGLPDPWENEKQNVIEWVESIQ